MMLLALLLAAATPDVADPCAYDPGILKLGVDAFDQDMTGGWRALSERPGCERRAAEVVRQYREATAARIGLLYWHEAQLRAMIGDYGAAIGLMTQARKPVADDRFGWNAYVDASIAFLKNDRAGLLRSRRALLAGRRPSDFPADIKWPMNIDVVDGLLRCLGKPYKEAYGQACRR